jgi:hypothetical protein
MKLSHLDVSIDRQIANHVFLISQANGIIFIYEAMVSLDVSIERQYRESPFSLIPQADGTPIRSVHAVVVQYLLPLLYIARGVQECAHVTDGSDIRFVV